LAFGTHILIIEFLRRKNNHARNWYDLWIILYLQNTWYIDTD